MSKKFEQILSIIKKRYTGKDFIPLHVPVFEGNEKAYVLDAIESTFVSSVGEYVNRFEQMMAQITGAKYAIATVNGTNALHMGLLVGGVKAGDEVLTQALTFIATANALSYIGASPVFLDVDRDTAGLSPAAVSDFLEQHAEIRADGLCYNKETNKRIAACVPMHTFGLAVRIEELAQLCTAWNIALIEDAAESIGSYVKGQHTGTFGKVGVFSFNGNKTVTAGGGGALITNDEAIAKRAKHLTTQAKVPHRWEFVHDDIGYNYRMPNLNAALICAQLESLPAYLASKRDTAAYYHSEFKAIDQAYLEDLPEYSSNYWLNALIFDNLEERNNFLAYSNDNGVMTRPVWELMNRLSMFKGFQHDSLENSYWLADRIVNIPSSVK